MPAERVGRRVRRIASAITARPEGAAADRARGTAAEHLMELVAEPVSAPVSRAVGDPRQRVGRGLVAASRQDRDRLVADLWRSWPGRPCSGSRGADERRQQVAAIDAVPLALRNQTMISA